MDDGIMETNNKIRRNAFRERTKGVDLGDMVSELVLKPRLLLSPRPNLSSAMK